MLGHGLLHGSAEKSEHHRDVALSSPQEHLVLGRVTVQDNLAACSNGVG